MWGVVDDLKVEVWRTKKIAISKENLYSKSNLKNSIVQTTDLFPYTLVQMNTPILHNSFQQVRSNCEDFLSIDSNFQIFQNPLMMFKHQVSLDHHHIVLQCQLCRCLVGIRFSYSKNPYDHLGSWRSVADSNACFVC